MPTGGRAVLLPRPQPPGALAGRSSAVASSSGLAAARLRAVAATPVRSSRGVRPFSLRFASGDWN
eukprot:8341740-Lingulodinium_polyedra.AAC.1